MMEGKSADQISRKLRLTPPAHYLFRVESVSVLWSEQIEKYESCSFEVGGYKWRLCLYPNGNKKGGGEGHISLYLELSDADEYRLLGSDVTVKFSFFLLNQIKDEYLTVQDADHDKVGHFNAVKTRCGFAQFLSLDVFKDPCNGYLVDDACLFGAEIFVIKSSGKWECLSTIKDPPGGTFTWVVENFSKIEEEKIESATFTTNEIKWRLLLYPRGTNTMKNKSLSLFLEVVNIEELDYPWRLYARFQLRIKNQSIKKCASVWFSGEIKNWGFPELVTLSELNDGCNSFIVKDTLTLQAKITLLMQPRGME